MPFRRYLATQFSIVNDVYLDIQRRVDLRISKALGHDTPNWRLLNSCPACQYRLDGEASLPFSQLIAIDGNNSLRRVDPSVTKSTRSLQDTRGRQSDIWLSPEEVNCFKDEVKKKSSRVPAVQQDDDNIEGDVTDGLPEVSACAERWRAAGPEERKRMWKMFTESGVFVSVCRHGFILLICDMIQSGEL